MRVFFVPNYFYLIFPIYKEIIHLLSISEATSYILRLPWNIGVPAEESFDSAYFAYNKLNYIDIPILRVPSYREGLLNKIKLLTASFKNWETIWRLVRNQQPDVVVVGSDLGNISVRFLMDACSFYHIPVVILYICDFQLSNKDKTFRNVLSFFLDKFSLRLKIKILYFLRALLFTGETPGSYATSATICVISENVRQKLILGGISKDRIIVTGDIVPSTLKGQSKDAKEEILNKLSFPIKNKLVVFFTECIQGVYGENYACFLYTRLRKIFDLLPNGISVVVKLHPREDKNSEKLIRKTFSSCRCRVVKDFDTNRLLFASDLSIAHFSAVLITAAAIRHPFLSINWRGDREKTFILPEESPVIEIHSPEETGEKILKALSEPSFKQQLASVILDISKRYCITNGLDKVTSVILQVGEKVKNTKWQH